jgi:hypothetical protein
MQLDYPVWFAYSADSNLQPLWVTIWCEMGFESFQSPSEPATHLGRCLPAVSAARSSSATRTSMSSSSIDLAE